MLFVPTFLCCFVCLCCFVPVYLNSRLFHPIHFHFGLIPFIRFLTFIIMSFDFCSCPFHFSSLSIHLFPFSLFFPFSFHLFHQSQVLSLHDFESSFRCVCRPIPFHHVSFFAVPSRSIPFHSFAAAFHSIPFHFFSLRSIYFQFNLIHACSFPSHFNFVSSVFFPVHFGFGCVFLRLFVCVCVCVCVCSGGVKLYVRFFRLCRSFRVVPFVVSWGPTRDGLDSFTGLG